MVSWFSPARVAFSFVFFPRSTWFMCMYVCVFSFAMQRWIFVHSHVLRNSVKRSVCCFSVHFLLCFLHSLFGSHSIPKIYVLMLFDMCVDSASIRVLVPMFTWKRIRKICDRKFIWLRSGHYYDHNGCERASGRVKRRANHHEKWASNFRYFCEKYLFIFADVSVLSFFTVSFWLCCCCSIVSLFRFDPISVGRFVFILHPLALSLSFFRVYFYRNWNIYFLLYSVFGLINCANSRTEKNIPDRIKGSFEWFQLIIVLFLFEFYYIAAENETRFFGKSNSLKKSTQTYKKQTNEWRQSTQFLCYFSFQNRFELLNWADKMPPNGNSGIIQFITRGKKCLQNAVSKMRSQLSFCWPANMFQLNFTSAQRQRAL